MLLKAMSPVRPPGAIDKVKVSQQFSRMLLIHHVLLSCSPAALGVNASGFSRLHATGAMGDIVWVWTWWYTSAVSLAVGRSVAALSLPGSRAAEARQEVKARRLELVADKAEP